MQKLLPVFSTISCVLTFTGMLSGCSKAPELIQLQGFTQGTTYHITFTSLSPTAKPSIETEIKAELERLDKSISNYRSDSTIEIFNAHLDTLPHEVNTEIVDLIEAGRSVHKASLGCYDLTIKPLFELWGFKKDSFHLPDEYSLAENLKLVGMDKLITLDETHLKKSNPNLRIDLSSIGQGYSVGRLANILEQHGIANYLVEIGGELKIRGRKPDNQPWRVALEKPLANERKLEKIITFQSDEPLSLMTSGTYRHYFDQQGKRYSHILNARTGAPVTHATLAASVLMQDPTLADAWSTALLCLGSDDGIRVANEQGISALFIDQINDQLVEKKSLPLTTNQTITMEPIASTTP